MPNRMYEKGRRKEQMICRTARSEGKIAIRSAGSKSPIDCVLIDVVARTIKFVQCKPDTYTHSQREALEIENSLLNGGFEGKFIVL